MAAYQDAVELRPEWGEAWNNLGMALRQTGRITDARQAFETALRLLPDSPIVRANLAAIGR